MKKLFTTILIFTLTAGCNKEEFDHTLVADYDWFNDFWQEVHGITTVQGEYMEDKSLPVS